MQNWVWNYPSKMKFKLFRKSTLKNCTYFFWIESFQVILKFLYNLPDSNSVLFQNFTVKILKSGKIFGFSQGFAQLRHMTLVSLAPPHHTLPAFINLHGMLWHQTSIVCFFILIFILNRRFIWPFFSIWNFLLWQFLKPLYY